VKVRFIYTRTPLAVSIIIFPEYEWHSSAIPALSAHRDIGTGYRALRTGGSRFGAVTLPRHGGTGSRAARLIDEVLARLMRKGFCCDEERVHLGQYDGAGHRLHASGSDEESGMCTANGALPTFAR
jgi:hypothetical protein